MELLGSVNEKPASHLVQCGCPVNSEPWGKGRNKLVCRAGASQQSGGDGEQLELRGCSPWTKTPTNYQQLAQTPTPRLSVKETLVTQHVSAFAIAQLVHFISMRGQTSQLGFGFWDSLRRPHVKGFICQWKLVGLERWVLPGGFKPAGPHRQLQTFTLSSDKMSSSGSLCPHGSGSLCPLVGMCCLIIG